MATFWRAITLSVLLAYHAAAAQQPAANAATRVIPPKSRTLVVMLGTGSPPADPDRFGPATVVIVDSTAYLVDAGVGVVRRWAAAIDKDIGHFHFFDLRHAFITHLHYDHTLGLSELIFSSWVSPYKPMEIFGPAGLSAMTQHLIAAYSEDIRIRTSPSGDRSGALPPQVNVHEIEPGVVYRDGLVTVTAFAVRHGAWEHAFGYRFQTPDKDIVISGDAAEPSAIPAQCHRCDILIHEGGEVLPNGGGPYWQDYHTNAQQLLEIAKAAQPKLLVLYHQLPRSNDAGLKLLREGYGPNVVIAKDLDIFR